MVVYENIRRKKLGNISRKQILQLNSKLVVRELGEIRDMWVLTVVLERVTADGTRVGLTQPTLHAALLSPLDKLLSALTRKSGSTVHFRLDFPSFLHLQSVH